MPTDMSMRVGVVLSVILPLLAFLTLVNEARAAAILNMTDQKVGFEIDTGSGFELVVIEPKMHYRVPGIIQVKKGREIIHIDYNEEYALWPNGDFAPQTRVKRKH